MAPDRLPRHRPLHGDQRAMIGADEPHTGGKMRGDVRVVRLLGGRVHDEKQHAVLGRIG